MKLSPTSKPDFVQLDYSECLININLQKDHYASKHVLEKTMYISTFLNGIQLHPQQKIDSCSRSVYIPYYPSKKRSCWITSHEMLVKIRTSGSSFFFKNPKSALEKSTATGIHSILSTHHLGPNKILVCVLFFVHGWTTFAPKTLQMWLCIFSEPWQSKVPWTWHLFKVG